MITERYDKKHCEFLRHQAKEKFNRVKGTWIELCRWSLPHRGRWMLSQVEGERNNNHIVDPTHILSLRSFVAGFLEGNTSAGRPWFRTGSNDHDLNNRPSVHMWLDKFTQRCHQVLSVSNFYHSAGAFYYDYGAVNTGAHYIDELDNRLHVHTLIPGSYFVINDGFGEAVVMVREFTLSVKALVDTYGKKNADGTRRWDNFSSHVKKAYQDANYTLPVDVVHVIKENDEFNPEQPQVGLNRKWISLTYEAGSGGQYIQGSEDQGVPDPLDQKKFLKINASKRKPFVVGKSTEGFEYGEKGPTLDALGLIKSLNKKAISKDQALELMIQPPLQGPASLRKSYVAQSARTYIPLDATSLAQKGVRSVYEINPAIAELTADQADLRRMVEKLYYADYLLFLSSNPKTRTATETDAIVREQQLVIGPNLQSLNWTYNVPIVEYVMDYVLFDDPWIIENPVPEELQGKFLRPEFISVFAQSQKAADLPAVERFISMVMNVGQIDPRVFDKVNLDKMCDLYEDRLFLPAGLNNPQAKVDALREQAQAQAQRQQELSETIPALAGAAKDVGLKVSNQ